MCFFRLSIDRAKVNRCKETTGSCFSIKITFVILSLEVV